MGKIRRVRQKYHASIGDSKNKCTEDFEDREINLTPAPVTIPSTGLFKGLEINYETLINQKLPDFDKISVRSLKREKPEKHLTKKEKIQNRRNAFLKKIEFIQQTKKEEKEKKKRQKLPIVGDMNLLADALPSLDQLTKKSEKKQKKEKQIKHRSIEKQKKRAKEMKKHIQTYRKVIKHPSFKSNPFETILDHVQNVVKLEKEKLKININ